MPIVEIEDDEDWYDDQSDDSSDLDDESAPCPECGQPVLGITAGKCPSCGYWLTETDRKSMWASESKPLWLTVTTVVLLAVFLASLAWGIF